MSGSDRQLLRWSRELLALGNNGITFANNDFDDQRYRRILRIGCEMMAELLTLPTDVAAAALEGDLGYATPKVDVRAAVIRDGKILLVREISDGRWTLPGGWADVGESPTAAVTREVLEESGLEVTVAKLFAVLDRDKHDHPPIPHHTYKLLFLCDWVRGTLRGSNETDGARFFLPDRLPPLSLTRVLPSQIAMAFRHHCNSNLPAECD